LVDSSNVSNIGHNNGNIDLSGVEGGEVLLLDGDLVRDGVVDLGEVEVGVGYLAFVTSLSYFVVGVLGNPVDD